MTDEPKTDLNLGEPPGRLKSNGQTSAPVWALAFFSLQIVILVCVAFSLVRSKEQPLRDEQGVSAESLKAVALELENKSLPGQSAEAWENYLAAAPNTDARAEILYRIGQQYLKAEQYGDAAAAFVRCEQEGLDDESLKAKLGEHMITCLRRLGRYGEVARELSRRVEVGGDEVKQGRVLATLAGEPLTEADLDRMIERRVDTELSAQGGTIDQSRRKQLIQFYSRPESRQQLLQEMLRIQLFTRRARELKLDRSEQYLAMRDSIVETILANQFQTQLLQKIQPTDVDLEGFYKANTSQYQRPESVQAIYEKLNEDDDPAKLLEEIKSADDFKKFVKARREDDEELEPFTLVRGARHPDLGDTTPLFSLAAGKWTTEPHAHGDDQFLVLIEEKTPAHTPPLSEIRQRVELDYRRRKEREIMQQLFDDLLVRYDVKIMPPPTSDDVQNKPDDSSEEEEE